jgi:hypothetical protein
LWLNSNGPAGEKVVDLRLDRLQELAIACFDRDYAARQAQILSNRISATPIALLDQQYFISGLWVPINLAVPFSFIVASRILEDPSVLKAIVAKTWMMHPVERFIAAHANPPFKRPRNVQRKYVFTVYQFLKKFESEKGLNSPVIKYPLIF